MHPYLVAPQISQEDLTFANLSTPSWSLPHLCSQYHISARQHTHVTLAAPQRQFFGEFAAFFSFIVQIFE